MTVIAIQGTLGSYSEEAARQITGVSAAILECPDFDSVFQAVAGDKADMAVVPVRNKIVGSIERPAELIEVYKMQVCGELKLPIEHILAGAAGSSIDDVSVVRSHIEALKQCEKYLSEHPDWKLEHGMDTAGSLKMITKNNETNTAAICGRRAAEIYGADILASSIADEDDNWTVFQLVGKKETIK